MKETKDIKLLILKLDGEFPSIHYSILYIFHVSKQNS